MSAMVSVNKTKKIILNTTDYNGKRVVFIKFSYETELVAIVMKLTDVKWSNTHRAWYVPYSANKLEEIKQIFEPYYIIDTNLLKQKIQTWIGKPGKDKPSPKK